jgi:hypothetical protein
LFAVRPQSELNFSPALSKNPTRKFDVWGAQKRPAI